MKSCRCVQCNVSSARYAWGFALLARDGWSVSDLPDSSSTNTENADTPGGGWVCPACRARNSAKQPGLAKPTTPAPSSRRSRPRSALRILLVDDEDMVRRCTARSLSDFDVVAVASGAEALALLANDCDFDVVLSDVMMPDMSGPQMFVRCCQIYPQLAQRFVFASGNPESARTELLKAVSAVGSELAPILLAKPSPREALLLAVYAAAAHGEPRSGTYSVAGAVLTEVRNYRG